MGGYALEMGERQISSSSPKSNPRVRVRLYRESPILLGAGVISLSLPELGRL